MYCESTRQKLNCNHKIDKYFEIGSKWSHDDYCQDCLIKISEIEEEELKE